MIMVLVWFGIGSVIGFVFGVMFGYNRCRSVKDDNEIEWAVVARRYKDEADSMRDRLIELEQVFAEGVVEDE